MHMQNFIEICLFILKILSKNAFWTWIKGHNYPISLLSDMQSLKKIGKKVLKLEHGNEVQNIFDIHQGP